VVVLGSRATLGTPVETLLWGCLSSPIALVVAFVLSQKRLPDPKSILALFDKREHCGGLLMSSSEISIKTWQPKIPQLGQPELGWRFQKPTGLLALSIAFLVAAFVIPQGFAEFGPRPLDITREKELLAAQIDILDKEQILDAPRAEAMKKALEQLEKESLGNDPVKTLESLDHLRNELAKAAKEALESALKNQENLAKAEKLAQGIEKSSSQLNDEQMTQAMEQLASATKKNLKEDELLKNGLDQETLDALKEGTLSAEQLSELMEALEGAKGECKGKIGKLVKAKLLKAEDLAECEKAGECDGDVLMAFLKENGCKGGLAQMLCENPGRGGLTEGPGSAKLDFGAETSDAGAKFKEVQLPQGNLDAVKKSQVTAMTKGQPQEKGQKASPTQSGALNQSESDGGSANTQPILPKHRGAVDRYFDRSPGNQTKKPAGKSN